MGKCESALLGLAIGDALGVPVEGSWRDDLRKNPIVDMVGFGSHNVPAGSWSDDTSMTIATMDAIANNDELDYYEIMNNFQLWFNKREFTPFGRVFDVGMTCARAIVSYGNNYMEPTEAGATELYGNGNGSLMRIMPIAFYSDAKSLTESKVCKVSGDVSAITHAHAISKMGCFIYVMYILELLHGSDKSAAYNKIKEMGFSEYFDEDTISVYDRILKNDISKYSEDEINTSGYVVDSLEASLWCFLRSDGYRNTVLQAVNLGRDADTTGAISGALAGIYYGKEDIPVEWIEKLARHEYLSELANQFEEKIYGKECGDI